MSAYAEKEALLGRSAAPDLMLSDLEKQNRSDIQEVIGMRLDTSLCINGRSFKRF